MDCQICAAHPSEPGVILHRHPDGSWRCRKCADFPIPKDIIALTNIISEDSKA